MGDDEDNALKDQGNWQGFTTASLNPLECEIISHAVWLYFRFPLNHRDVEGLLFVRGVIVSYELEPRIAESTLDLSL